MAVKWGGKSFNDINALVKWINAHGGKTTAAQFRARHPKAFPVAVDPLAARSQAQLDADVETQVGNVLNPQMDAARRAAQQRIASIQGASAAATGLLSANIGKTQAGYDLATKEIQGIGGGYSDAAKARIKGAQDAAAQFAASQGAPAGTGAPVDATALGDTLYHGGVGIPGAALASEGATATALETQMAGIPVIQGQRDIAQAAAEGEQALLDLAAKRPELHDQILGTLVDQEMKKLDARLNQRQVAVQERAQTLYEANYGEKVRHDVAGEKLSDTRNKLSRLRYDEQVRMHNAAIDKAAAEGRQPNASLSRAYGYIVDKGGHPILDHNGHKIPVAKSTTAKSKKDKAAAQYQKAVGEANTMFKDSRKTLTDPTQPYDKDLNPYLPPKRDWKWGAAMRYLQSRYGLSKANARRALIAAGFKPAPRPGTYAGTGPYANTSPRK